MRANRVSTCSELTTGDHVEVLLDGVTRFSGRVTDMLPEHRLFWAVSDSGERRIIEIDQFEVHKSA